MSNGSPEILESPRVCHVLEFVKLLKSHCSNTAQSLSTLVRKRNATFHGAFLLRLSVYLKIM